MFNWLKRSAPKPAAEPVASAPDAPALAEAERVRGNALLEQGRLQEAAAAYEASITYMPGPGALVNLGFVLHELGRSAQAQVPLEHALKLDAAQFDAAFLLGVIAMSQGRAQDAVLRLRQALAIQPGNPMALGELCSAQFQAGDVDGARDTADSAVASHPEVPAFHLYLGNIHAKQGDFAQAQVSYSQALALSPGDPVALNNRAMALQSLGRLDDAQADLREALAREPGYPQAHWQLGEVLLALGRPQEALAMCEKACALAPTLAPPWNALGNVHQASGRHALAESAFREALSRSPDDAPAHNNLAMALMSQGRLADARPLLERAVVIDPTYADAFNNLGNLSQRQHRFGEAIAHYETSLTLAPGHVQAQRNLAGARQMSGEHQAAIEGFRSTLAGDPEDFGAWSNLLFGLSYQADCPPWQYLAEARRFGEAARRAARPQDLPPFAARTSTGRRTDADPLRVGFVSGDLCEHPVGYFLENVLAHLDDSRLELFAYPTQGHEDALSARIRPRFRAWRGLAGLTDEVAARLIREDGIDVLIDLAGHTAHNRLPLFAWRPAPTQVSWLGYFASTGLEEMDFFLADAVGVPQSRLVDFSERVVYLPDTRLCFSEPRGDALPEPGPLPALTRGYVTFGCFQNMTKLNDAVLRLWGQVMSAVPGSRLRLQSGQMADAGLRERLLGRLSAAGIDADRVELAGPSSRLAYFHAHREVDVLLDTFPFTGGTTTCEALWMGVPSLTLAGTTLLARQGASLLSCSGLADWVATSPQEYVSIAGSRCSDLPGLARLRASLRSRVLKSPLFDGPRFARHLEDALIALAMR